MGVSVPLLNEYKQNFFQRRFPRTITGGIHCRFGYPVPNYAYVTQILLFLFPWLFSVVFIALIQYRLLNQDIGAYIYGSCVFLFVFITHIISTTISSKRRREKTREKSKTMFSILDEEDHVDFDGFFGRNTFTFLFPAKKYKINIVIHAISSGIISGLSLIYLHPRELDYLYLGNVPAIVIIFILGWLTVCVALYSYTSSPPPELATYHALDTYEVTPHTRPFYVLFFLVFYIITRQKMPFFVCNQALHATMVTLPLLWTLGILPPVDALFSWLLEQVLLVILGGSPMATELRMLCILALSIATTTAVYLLPFYIASVCVATCMGYILSIDIPGFTTRFVRSILQRNKINDTITQQKIRSNTGSASENRGCFWTCGYRECLYHLFMVIIVFLLSFMFTFNYTVKFHKFVPIFGYVVLTLAVVEMLSCELQSVYVFFGMIRNPIYPKSFENEEEFSRRKKKMRPLRLVHRFILNWGELYRNCNTL